MRKLWILGCAALLTGVSAVSIAWAGDKSCKEQRELMRSARKALDECVHVIVESHKPDGPQPKSGCVEELGVLGKEARVLRACLTEKMERSGKKTGSNRL